MNFVPIETDNIAQLHRAEYESLPDIVVSAPGIVRMMGENTIDAEGLMLTFPMERRVSIAISYRRDSSIRFYASDLNERKRTNLSNLRYKREDRWANLIKASISAYLGEVATFKGFNITVSGDVPLGLGLGSATALRSAAAKAAALISGFDPGSDEIAASIAELFAEATGVPCMMADEPSLCVAKGTGVALENLESYKRSILASR